MKFYSWYLSVDIFCRNIQQKLLNEIVLSESLLLHYSSRMTPFKYIFFTCEYMWKQHKKTSFPDKDLDLAVLANTGITIPLDFWLQPNKA